MESNKIDMFLLANSKFFPAENLPMIRSQLEKADDTKFMNIQAVQYRDPGTMIIISLFAGHFGVDRFMLGETGLGVAKLLTCGGFGIWTIIDWFLIMQHTREINLDNLMRQLSYA
ncbi:MAG: TM2 domain-containing protein [Chitinophagales bacterium]